MDTRDDVAQLIMVSSPGFKFSSQIDPSESDYECADKITLHIIDWLQVHGNKEQVELFKRELPNPHSASEKSKQGHKH